MDDEVKAALRRLQGLSNMTPDGRTLYGVPWQEITRRAWRWWDKTGRHLSRNPEFKDPDVGFVSGITRGLMFEHLTRQEGLRVVHAYEVETVRPEFRDEIAAYFEREYPRLLGDPALVEWLGADLVRLYAEGHISNDHITNPEKSVLH